MLKNQNIDIWIEIIEAKSEISKVLIGHSERSTGRENMIVSSGPQPLGKRGQRSGGSRGRRAGWEQREVRDE